MAGSNFTRRTRPFKDLTGERFGRWIVLGRDTSHPSKAIYWICRCDCGIEKTIGGGDLKGNRSKGCIPCSKRVHGLSQTSEYGSWQLMNARCHNPQNKNFPAYGGNGITVCERWKSLENFCEDMGAKPSPKHTIERVDNSKGYSPDNCIWATRKEQVLNRSCTRMITFQGETLCLSDWSTKLRINRGTLRTRLKYGWSIKRAFTEPVKKLNRSNS